MNKLSATQRYGLFGIWAGIHILAFFFSSFFTGLLALTDLITLLFVLPLTPSLPLPPPPLRDLQDEERKEQALSLLEYLREIESGFHQRLDGLEDMLEENTLLTKIRRRGKGTLTLVPNEHEHEQMQHESAEPSEPDQRA